MTLRCTYLLFDHICLAKMIPQDWGEKKENWKQTLPAFSHLSIETPVSAAVFFPQARTACSLLLRRCPYSWYFSGNALDTGRISRYTEHCSHWGDKMNTAVTSKEDILKASRELIQRQGWSAINIRSVAGACGVSVGSIYNYYGSKAALVSATVESVWREIFHRPEEETGFKDTLACIAWMYGRMEYGRKQYPGFFALHSFAFMQEEKARGKQKMHQTWQHILEELCAVLKRDSRIRDNAFTEQFTVEQFADVLFSLILSALLRHNDNSAAVLELVRRTLY